MAVAILCIWLYFVIAFVLVRLLFPELVANKRTRKQIKGAREYDESGYDSQGFTPLGYHRNGTRYDDEGYDRDGFDKEGNPRQKNEYDNEIARQIKVSVKKRKAIITSVLVPLAIVLIVVPLVNFAVNDSCLLGHNPVYTFCESPIKCTKCEREIGNPPGHKWHKDTKTGEEICTECRAVRSELE